MKPAWKKRIYLIWILSLCLITAGYVLIDIPAARSGDVEGFVVYLDQVIPEYMQKHNIAGVAVGLIHDGEVVHLTGYGYADAQKQVPVTESTVFQVASVSKAVTAWGVMNLVEDGLLELDAPVSRYLTRWQLPLSEYDNEGVTIRRLLSHSAGIAHVGGYTGFDTQEEIQTLEESLTSAQDANGEGVRIVSDPGTKYRYSGGSFTLLQLVIEEVTGLPFETYMQDEILTPLHMQNSGFILTSPLEENFSVVYDENGNVTASRFFTARAAAGLYTTAKDLTAWAMAMMPASADPQGTGVLQPDTLAEMFRPQPGLPRMLPYGLGCYLQEVCSGQYVEVAHTGKNLPGWYSLVTTVPQKGEGLVVLTNAPGGLKLREVLWSGWLRWVTGCSSFSLRLDKLINTLMIVVPVGIAGALLMLIVFKILDKRNGCA